MSKLIHPSGGLGGQFGLIWAGLMRLRALHARLRLVWPTWLPRTLAPLLALLLGHVLADAGIYPPLLFFAALLFAFFAAVLQRWAAFGAAIGLESLFNSIDSVKQAMTDEPLVARDLWSASQGGALTSYLNAEIIGWTLLLLLSIAIGLYYRPRLRIWRVLTGAILPALLLSRVFAPPGVNGYANALIEDGLGAHYLSYNFHENVRQNGILAHLYQTAESVAVPEPGPHDFYAVTPLTPAGTTVQPDIVMILCEACFSSRDERFVTPLADLRRSGFVQTSVVSPVYGGGTAEAEFEYLTGMPSTVLPGIDYQNFAGAYRDGARTLVSKLRHAGYRTIGMHNFYGSFWKREEVYPKLGFQETHFIDDMKWEEDGWPADALMYKRAQQVYAQQPRGGHTFMFLVTVRTHGAYTTKEGDGGRGDYETRLRQSVTDLQRFVKAIDAQAKKRKREVMYVLVGDHKPSLSKAFHDAGVFDAGFFRSVGSSNADFQFALKLTPEQQGRRGEVPLFVRYGADKQRAERMADQAAGRPMFCVPAVVSQQLPYRGQYFDTLASRCSAPAEQMTVAAAEGWQRDFPRALFAERLF
ncbi:Sulfatase [Andreprevotia lacus DSM 23236]|jgi:phosphoglycerol transferase MdoB-like AlkP superfamily enzyme|uniref:Sulfatase n=1 Tax=Andreprevotia lacus DSM 23236 TaxID=1121001 RepID=A0A1W1Y0P9_9NEIS|nr:LTA synthase family protein [Andreprevotia lacus]SMC29743.1 Sulfatase [Andreprevotia lacus DSM 23236]